ncbi:hypothetical protein L596_020858 [Steinernema carpocapsae]|uniref:Uncharacterized protein n=1 Tax=Steinernema carpocapsae TaxID=34508 RepID=A0A4U5MUR7_STECR|nr:hypothetical protein L596_020781 [Steinernema carpocapsae]TKR73560.1 hypothetical protein L596_020858 [Steinernema carpocapsae]
MANAVAKTISCGCCSIRVKNATTIIAVLAIIGGLYNVGTIPHRKMGENFKFYILISNILWTLSALLAILGVFFKSCHILLPFLAMLTFSLVTLVIGLVVASFLLITIAEQTFEEQGDMVAEQQNLVYIVIVLIIAIPIVIWFIAVVKKCYTVLKQASATHIQLTDI